MWTHVAAVGGVALMCALWIVVQRFFAEADPAQPGVEGHQSCKSDDADCSSSCGTCSVSSTCSVNTER